MGDLISLTSAFLTATGLFFTALGATATYNEPLKAFLSLSALLMSIVWFLVLLWLPGVGSGNAVNLLQTVLPALFILGWTISSGIHSYRWVKGIKGPIEQHQ
ncbi:TPA: hypothetical protein I7232_21820 [Vibrio vulnificus]|nr:hypothetical protein [Vibrio vulnificus]HDY7608192.1 hypothetical protein [Vibrio vulnificus]